MGHTSLKARLAEWEQLLQGLSQPRFPTDRLPGPPTPDGGITNPPAPAEMAGGREKGGKDDVHLT